MKCASYREAVAWIALNDSAGEGDESYIAQSVAELVTVCLVADLFGVEEERVARDVVRYRWKQQKAER